MHLYSSVFIDPFKFGTWALTRESVLTWDTTVCMYHVCVYVCKYVSYFRMVIFCVALYCIDGPSLHIQWNLQTMDTLGAGVLSTVERLSLSRRFANKPRPSILRSRIV